MHVLSIFRGITGVALSLAIVAAVQAQYSGGSGTADDPYQIATAADLIALGETPGDYDKHFILTADIDLDPNLPGGKVFDRAVIAPGTVRGVGRFEGTPFSGVFDGGGHTILHLKVIGKSYLGLFGEVVSEAVISNLGLETVDVNGTGDYIGGLVGSNGDWDNEGGIVTNCYSAGTIRGYEDVGGLVGRNWGSINTSYSTATVSGDRRVGGLVGYNRYADITHCYSVGLVCGGEVHIKGLVGMCDHDEVTDSFWDVETSGQAYSNGGIGLTTAEMQTMSTFLGWGTCGNGGTWTIDEGNDYPRLAWEGRPGEPIALGPTLADLLDGEGTPDSPYLVYTAEEFILIRLFPCDWDKHFRLMADIDLDPNLPGRKGFDGAIISPDEPPSPSSETGYSVTIGFQGTPFTGLFDGNSRTISRAVIEGCQYVGVFGVLGSQAEIRNLGLVDITIDASDGRVGALAGQNEGRVIGCYSTGSVNGRRWGVGGLLGDNSGQVIRCHCAANVSGNERTGDYYIGVGGLLGRNSGQVIACCSTGPVSGGDYVGGLVGWDTRGEISSCYSTGSVSGTGHGVGGFVGYARSTLPTISACFWDIETSGQTASDGGIGLTTAEMQDISIYLSEGWDFVGESENGLHEFWQMPEGGGYPVQAIFHGYEPPELAGAGTQEDPYLISSAPELGSIIYHRSSAHYRLTGTIDLAGIQWTIPVIPNFQGTFDGNNFAISHLVIDNLPRFSTPIGFFGRLESGAEVINLDIVDVNVVSSGDEVGGLAGYNGGSINSCSSTGTVSGNGTIGGLVGYNRGSITSSYGAGVDVSGTGDHVGGLAGENHGSISSCYSTGTVSGAADIGGLVGENWGSITTSWSRGAVIGELAVGGLVGENAGSVSQSYAYGSASGECYVGGLVGCNYHHGPERVGYPGIVTYCYSTGAVSGVEDVGGLVGDRLDGYGPITITNSFWDIETSGTTDSDGGTRMTTAEMQSASTFLEAGWDFVDETENGTDDIWWILEGQDYPRLWWEEQPTRLQSSW